MTEKTPPMSNGIYKSLTLILASILATGLFGYLSGERQALTEVELLKAEQQATVKYIEEQKLHDLEMDRRLRILETEIAEVRAKQNLPHRNIAPISTAKNDHGTSESR